MRVVINFKNMILDSVKSFERYQSFHKNFDKVYKFIRTNNMAAMEDGRYEISGKDVYVSISSEELRGDDAPMEVHDSYIDIHVVLEGIETYGMKDRSKCIEDDAKYDDEKDIAFLANDVPDNYVSVGAGNFVVIFPSDAHAPLLGSGKVKKAVFKVKVFDIVDSKKV